MVEVSLDSIREELQTCAQRYGMSEIPPEVWDQNASVLRDAMVSMGLDPADRTVLDSMMLASFLCMGHLVNSQIVIGPAIPLTYIQTQLCRMWIDQEMPVMSLSEIMGLHALEAMNPQKCSYTCPWPDGRGQSACLKMEGHESPHRCPIVEVGEDGGMTMYEVDVEEA